jgi:hypothetical protein
MPRTPFTTLLRMKLLAAGLDGKCAGERTLIPRSRFREISSGRTRPTQEECRSLLDLGLTAGTADHVLLDQARNDPTGLAWTLWRSVQATLPRPERVEAELCVDRLSITANARSEPELRALAKSLGKKSPKGDRLYRARYDLPGMLLQFEPTISDEGAKDDDGQSARRFARVELWQRELLHPRSSRRIFEVLDLDDAAITRIDIAVDLNVDFRLVHVVPVHKGKVSARWYWGQHGIETLYLFANPRKLRIYDKAREQDVEQEATRFEAELRKLDLGPKDLLRVENPFRRITLVEFANEGSLEQQLLAREARLFGIPAVLASLDEAERASLRRTLHEARWLLHPRDVFDERWRETARRLMKRLGW